MSIDGIGKGPPAVPDVGGAGSTQKASASFRVATAEAEAVSEPTAHGALEQLQRGELSVEAFLEVKVEAAVQHLQLPPEQLNFVKSELREQLRTDPVLLELVRRTTGELPSADGG